MNIGKVFDFRIGTKLGIWNKKTCKNSLGSRYFVVLSFKKPLGFEFENFNFEHE